MSIDMNCMYCNRTEKIEGLMISVCTLKASEIFFWKEQTHPGRCVITAKEHIEEIYLLDPETRENYFKEMNALCKTIGEMYKPAKLNMAVFGDKMKHLHFHIVPKYEDGHDFGKAFGTTPIENPVYLTDEEYKDVVAKIKAGIEQSL